MDNIYVTIGRQFGSGGREIGKKVAEALGIPYYDKELLVVAAKESGLSHQFLTEYDEKPNNSFLYSLVMGQSSLVGG
ncbi:MAG: cytidylate kinase-like family protein, partial [Oscillospiraceae bacterium]|nr:cytidylate kinase-like family protein [Oscillospiraceae bacterium]